ncbi:hypothetical protein J7M02_03780 [Candidatus Aerophobetes bacterium]|nr:hypothetical protein [Candidatus Aerophobetes bacterium]
MWGLILKILGYLFGVVGGISLVIGVILRLSRGPAGTLISNLRANAFVEFSQVCLIFAIAFGVAAIMESMGEKKEKGKK